MGQEEVVAKMEVMNKKAKCDIYSIAVKERGNHKFHRILYSLLHELLWVHNLFSEFGRNFDALSVDRAN